jgi:hypothetical protein
MLRMFFLGLCRDCTSSVPPCTALGAARRIVPYSAHSNLTLQIYHIIAVKKAEGIELELGHILLWGVEVGIGIVFDAPGGKKSHKSKKISLCKFALTKIIRLSHSF